MDGIKDLEFETGFVETKFGWGKDRVWPCGCNRAARSVWI
jgi:hypothetical protein